MISSKDLHRWSFFAPLIAAIIAPTFTLLSIPALTENWFAVNGLPTSDSTANIILSSIELFLTVAANATLILRFSVKDGWWSVATKISILCWFLKLVIAFFNLLFFALKMHNVPGVSYDEGFWCATLTLISSGLIFILLLCHYVLGYKVASDVPTTKQLHMRVSGRHFMLHNVFFTFLTGILALIMSRLEHWTFLQGIYFSTLSFLTLGYGDFYPTKVSTQIIVFPFLLVGIAQLANLIGMIVSFFSERAENRTTIRRISREKEMQLAYKCSAEKPDLDTEIKFLRELSVSEEWNEVRGELIWSLSGFVIFWVIGALIFSQTESWTYGQGLYFCYISFFAIGYGDFAPVTPAGRVLIVVYALIAVPIMASFAVETVTKIFRKLSDHQLRSRKADVGLNTDDILYHTHSNIMDRESAPSIPSSSAQNADNQVLPTNERKKLNDIETQHSILPHSHFVESYHEQIEKQLLRRNAHNNVEKAEMDEDRILTEHLLELAVELERHARKLLIAHMDRGSSGQILLKADRNVQMRAVKTLAEEVGENTKENSNSTKFNEIMQKLHEEEDIGFSTQNMDEKESLEEIRKYRESFAGILATGTRLMKLKGEERFLFERRVQDVQNSKNI